MNDKSNSAPFESLAATTFVNSSLLAALVAKLAERGILEDHDTREIYDNALFALEQAEAAAESEEMKAIYSAARKLIEAPLKES